MTATATPTERLPITDRQREVFDFISAYCTRHGYGPTIREIMAHFGFSTTNAVTCHLRPLRKRGWLSWIDGTSRTIQPTGGDV